MLGNLGFFTFSSPSFSVLMLFCILLKTGKCQIDDRERRERNGQGAKVNVKYLYLGEKVDPDPFGLQTARLLDPHTKVLHVCIDDILHCSAE